MSNVIITGARSGCGRGFVEAFSKDPSNTIVAIDQTFRPIATFAPPSSSDPKRCDAFETKPKLEAEQPYNQGTIFTHEADLSSESSVASLSIWLSSLELTFDVVIHCAGVRGLVPSVPISDQESIAVADSLGHMDATTMMRTFATNSLGSFLFLRAILPFCRRCSLCETKTQDGCEVACSSYLSPTKILILGSRLGSMTASSALGGCYAYRASKAAQHSIFRSLVADVPDIIWVLCHPGRVQTGLVPVKEEGAIGVKESVAEMMKLLEAATRKDSGRFMDRFGQDIPW